MIRAPASGAFQAAFGPVFTGARMGFGRGLRRATEGARRGFSDPLPSRYMNFGEESARTATTNTKTAITSITPSKYNQKYSEEQRFENKKAAQQRRGFRIAERF
jgi:hypothetical protein